MLTIPLTLICAVSPWLTRQLKRWGLTLLLLMGIALGVMCIVFSLAFYPWTDLIVLLVALAGGLLLGRSMPLRFWPFFILLLVLSVLDVLQIVLTANSSPPGSSGSHMLSGSNPLLLVNFRVLLPWGRYNIGLFDLLLITALAEHWRRRGASYVIACLPGVLGFLVSYAFIWLGSLPLIPFITLGWLGSEGVQRILSRKTPPQNR